MKYLALTLLALSLSSIKTLESSAQGLTFVQSPSLVSMDTSERDPNVRNVTYSVQISVPQQAGSSLQKVTIAQKDPLEPISFSPERTTAYIQETSGDRTPIQTTTAIDPSTRAISVIFASPVGAGKTVVVGLRPVSNPSLEGEYVFSVTVFASGEQERGQFIGDGRLGFYNTAFLGAILPTP